MTKENLIEVYKLRLKLTQELLDKTTDNTLKKVVEIQLDTYSEILKELEQLK